MQKWRTVAAVAIVAFWAAMSSHCLLESAAGFGFLRCDPALSTGAVPSSHCDDAACQSIESGHYLASNPVTLRLFRAAALLFEAPASAESTLPAEVSGGVLTAAPPDLPKRWQFSFRAALPVRAPSLVS